jgi:hypothetical protein
MHSRLIPSNLDVAESSRAISMPDRLHARPGRVTSAVRENSSRCVRRR